MLLKNVTEKWKGRAARERKKISFDGFFVIFFAIVLDYNVSLHTIKRII